MTKAMIILRLHMMKQLILLLRYMKRMYCQLITMVYITKEVSQVAPTQLQLLPPYQLTLLLMMKMCCQVITMEYTTVEMEEMIMLLLLQLTTIKNQSKQTVSVPQVPLLHCHPPHPTVHQLLVPPQHSAPHHQVPHHPMTHQTQALHPTVLQVQVLSTLQLLQLPTPMDLQLLQLPTP